MRAAGSLHGGPVARLCRLSGPATLGSVIISFVHRSLASVNALPPVDRISSAHPLALSRSPQHTGFRPPPPVPGWARTTTPSSRAKPVTSTSDLKPAMRFAPSPVAQITCLPMRSPGS
jgi:hypothetical protein